MSAVPSHLLICSCEKTMPLDAAAIGRGCAGKITQANQLCGLELDRFKAGAGRRRADHGGVHPGSPAVSRSRGEFTAGRAHLRQHSRNRRLVERRGRGRPEGRGADRGGAGRHAADLAGDAGEQRRRADLWPRRGRDRGRAASRRPSRHHRAAEQTRRRRRRAAPTNSRCSRAPSAMPAAISAPSSLRSTTMRCRSLRRARNWCSGRRAMAPPRPAT